MTPDAVKLQQLESIPLAVIRRQAASSGDLARAWDASSAAAGALMLSARARTEIQSLLRPPELK